MPRQARLDSSEYDFSKGQRGKFYRQDMKLDIPIYLDEVQLLSREPAKKDIDRSSVVNELPRGGIKIGEAME
ncbi:MAG: hypothetical protein EHM54_10220 [Nitrospiraceae bacterium]|nr:MAG: hypothetical protein EHM54_10220 [Nitrospiraceae bacterium]